MISAGGKRRFDPWWVCILSSLWCGSLGAQALHEQREFTWMDCYAHLRGGELTMGNAHMRRSWKIVDGQLYATSLFDIDTGKEWLELNAPLPSPTSPGIVVHGPLILRGGGGVFGATETGSLRVELEETSGVQTIKYEFQIFPRASGVRIWLSEAGNVHPKLTNSIPSEILKRAQDDAIEHLRLTRPHLRLTQVTLRDDTDDHNELVFENEWLLHPNESLLELSGNVFIIEDVLTGEGLIQLKEAPEPEMRPLKCRFDLRLTAGLMGSPRRLTTPSYLDISFYGHGYEGDGKGYPTVLMTYHGGRAGRIAALQQYQRQLREFVPGRDGQLLSNTWGDRSNEIKLSAEFIRKEVDAGKALGVDIVQIDDGWEKGITIGGKAADGVWEGYWAKDTEFWDTNPTRFPGGLRPLSDYAKAQGMRLGLWFGPDSAHDFANWQKDADELLALRREDQISSFKLDSVNIRTKRAEGNYHSLLDRIVERSSGEILLDLDVTAETRQGYFGNIAAGTLFIENRYSDWHRYWPHQTLRNLWKLAQYVDPVRLRMEFLNSERNIDLYAADPLAPSRYDPACLFAITMFSSPLGWFENTGLSPHFVASAAPVIARWKRERDDMYRGTILPIGAVPDGVTWTGFASLADTGNGGYLLVFREGSQDSSWTVPGMLFGNGRHRLELLSGPGTATESEDGIHVTIGQPLGYVWMKIGAADGV